MKLAAGLGPSLIREPVLESPQNLTVCPARTQMLEVGLHVLDNGGQRPLYLRIKFCKHELADFDGGLWPHLYFFNTFLVSVGTIF